MSEKSKALKIVNKESEQAQNSDSKCFKRGQRVIVRLDAKRIPITLRGKRGRILHFDMRDSRAVAEVEFDDESGTSKLSLKYLDPEDELEDSDEDPIDDELDLEVKKLEKEFARALKIIDDEKDQNQKAAEEESKRKKKQAEEEHKKRIASCRLQALKMEKKK